MTQFDQEKISSGEICEGCGKTFEDGLKPGHPRLCPPCQAVN